jgi:terminase small subunit-like protein
MPAAGDRGLRRGHPGTTKRGRGRPSAWSPELGKAICALIADMLSLRAICERPGMPDRRTVFRWLASREEFCHQYSLAREFQVHLLLDECIEIADDTSGDIIRYVTKNGREAERVNLQNIRRAKLRVATRKWMAGRLAPKKYGKRLTDRFNDPRGNGKGAQPAVILTIGPVTNPDTRGDSRSAIVAKTPKGWPQARRRRSGSMGS